ncbi:MAG: hypothetical protein QM651_09765 [Rhodoblastus sp.]
MLGAKGETQQIRQLTVVGSSVAASPEGLVAIVLETREAGTLAIPMTLESCEALRRDIAAAEGFLRQKPGTA